MPTKNKTTLAEVGTLTWAGGLAEAMPEGSYRWIRDIYAPDLDRDLLRRLGNCGVVLFAAGNQPAVARMLGPSDDRKPWTMFMKTKHISSVIHNYDMIGPMPLPDGTVFEVLVELDNNDESGGRWEWATLNVKS